LISSEQPSEKVQCVRQPGPSVGISFIIPYILAEFSRVESWIESTNPDALFASVLSFGEIRKGIELLQPARSAASLSYGWIPILRAIG
jgi:hypothetical protein